MGLIQGIINNQIFGNGGEGFPTIGNIGQVLIKSTGDLAEWGDRYPIKVVSDNYTVQLTDYIILCDFITEKIITLPTDTRNKAFIIKCISGSVKFTNELDGISNYILPTYGSLQVIISAEEYFIISSAGYGI